MYRGRLNRRSPESNIDDDALRLLLALKKINETVLEGLKTAAFVLELVCLIFGTHLKIHENSIK